VPDTFAPDAGQRITPDGHVSYDFDGHVHAQGLDLDAGTSNDPPDDRKVRWLTTNGAMVAEVFGWTGATDAEAMLLARRGELIPGVPLNAFLLAEADPANLNNTLALAGAGAVTARIIDALGQSRFLQLRTDAKLRAELNSVSFLNVPDGGPTVLAVSVPWTANHFGSAVLSVIPDAAYGFGLLPRAAGIGAAGLAFIVTDNPVTQNITVTWITLGN
jgi:hypothetical protein